MLLAAERELQYIPITNNDAKKYNLAPKDKRSLDNLQVRYGGIRRSSALPLSLRDEWV